MSLIFLQKVESAVLSALFYFKIIRQKYVKQLYNYTKEENKNINDKPINSQNILYFTKI